MIGSLRAYTMFLQVRKLYKYVDRRSYPNGERVIANPGFTGCSRTLPTGIL